MKYKNILKTTLKLILGIIFLYIAFFSIQNFWQGAHNLDLSYNFLKNGFTGDLSTKGESIPLDIVFLNGLNKIRMSFTWMTIDAIVAFAFGYLFKNGN